MRTVLLISKIKERAIRICKRLEASGYEVIMTSSLTPPSELLASEKLDVVLLELLSVPDNVEEMIKTIKENPQIKDLPLVALIGEDDVDRMRAVSRFDEVIIYPCSHVEMSLRLQLALRDRYDSTIDDVIKIDGLVINPFSYEVIVDKVPVALTYKEFELLNFLVRHQDRVVTRKVLVNNIWKYDHEQETRTVDVHVRRLRAKLGKYGNMIITVRKAGYRFSNPVTSAVLN